MGLDDAIILMLGVCAMSPFSGASSALGQQNRGLCISRRSSEVFYIVMWKMKDFSGLVFWVYSNVSFWCCNISFYIVAYKSCIFYVIFFDETQSCWCINRNRNGLFTVSPFQLLFTFDLTTSYFLFERSLEREGTLRRLCLFRYHANFMLNIYIFPIIIILY